MSTVDTPVALLKTPARWKADLALAVVGLMWGTTFVAVKGALRDISAMYFLAVRFSLAAVCMVLIFAGHFRSQGAMVSARGFSRGAIVGVFLWLGYMLQTFGLKFTSAGNSGFITGLYIVFVPLLSAAIYRRWPRPLELAGVGIAAAGMALLTLPSIRQLRFNIGDLLTVFCAVAFAAHLLLLGYFSRRESFQAVALGQITCTAALSAFSLVFEPPHATWSLRVVLAILFTASFATALAFALQTWGQRYTTPTRTALIFALEPVFALATAVLFGGESLTAYSVAGGAVILAGILLVELKPAATG